MKNGQHVGFWLAIICLAFLLGPLMRPGDQLNQFALAEIEQTRQAFGDTVAEKLVEFAVTFFEGTPLGMVSQTAVGLKHSEADIRLAQAAAGSIGVGMSKVFNGYLQGLSVQAFVVAMRFAVVLVWLLLLGPLLVAAVVDGLAMRNIKILHAGSLRPATFTLMGMFVIPMLFAPLVYLVVPFTVSPLLAPLWACMVALPLSKMVSNMQPVFTSN